MKNLPQLGDLTTIKNTDFIIFEERTNNKNISKKSITKKNNKINNKNTNKKHNKRTNKKRKSSSFFGLFK